MFRGTPCILIISVFQGWGRWHVYNIGSINLVFDPIYTLNYKINKIPSLRSQKNVLLITMYIFEKYFMQNCLLQVKLIFRGMNYLKLLTPNKLRSEISNLSVPFYLGELVGWFIVYNKVLTDDQFLKIGYIYLYDYTCFADGTSFE